MTIILVRHGDYLSKIEDPAEGLSPKGEKEVKELLQKMKTKNLSFEHVYASNKTRAQQTAGLLACGIKVEELQQLLPQTNPKVLFEKIQELPQNALFVGHNPLLSSLSFYFDFPHQFETADCLVIKNAEKKYLI